MADAQFDIKYVAHLARLTLTPEEEKQFGAQLGDVIGYIEKLKTSGYNAAKELNDRLIARMSKASKL